jgi:hypothetical protein
MVIKWMRGGLDRGLMTEDKETEKEKSEKAEKAEKQRLLSELAAKGDFKKAKKPTSEIEDQEALGELFRQSVKLPDVCEEEIVEESLTEAAAVRPISKITHHEIKAMRAVTTADAEPMAVAQHKVGNFMIRGWDAFVASLRPKTLKCAADGHECIHCGARFGTETAKDPKKQKVATS